MILVDTSVWIDHFHRMSPTLASVLEQGEVAVHPFVVGEIACGLMKNRDEVLGLFAKVPQTVVASHEEVLALIDRRRLMGRGIGYIDAHLLASIMLSERTQLWTRDKHLLAVASDLRLPLYAT